MTRRPAAADGTCNGPARRRPSRHRTALSRRPIPDARTAGPASCRATSGQPRETPDHEFPFVLTTGRLYAHWHTLTRTGKSPKLVRREPGPFVEVHPDDAASLDWPRATWCS